MRKITKRLTALLCAVLMAVTLLPAQAWAVEGTDGGSATALEEPIVNDKPAMDEETTTDGQPADDQTPAPTGDETPDAEDPEENESVPGQEMGARPIEEEQDGGEDRGTLCWAYPDGLNNEIHVEELTEEETAALTMTPWEELNSPSLARSSAGVDPYFEIITVERYGRSKLEKMSKKAIYLDIYDTLLLMASSNFQGVLETPNGTTIYSSDAALAINAFYADYPELFWARPTYYYYKANPNLCAGIAFEYNSHYKNLNKELPLFLETANNILAGMPTGSDYEKELYLHDVLVNKVTYTSSKLEEQNGYTTLVDGKGVCAGYAFALQYLLMRAGIQSYYVVGFAGENHAWNLAKIDGKWYYVDATWDDPLNNGSDDPYSPYYSYFNITTKKLKEDHTPFDTPYNVTLEKCTATAANYYTVNSHLVVSTKDASLPGKVANLLQRNNGVIRLFVTDDDPGSTAWQWYKDNISNIATAMEAYGQYQYGYWYFNHEVVLWFEGDYLALGPGELNGYSGITILDVDLLYQYLRTQRVPITQTRLMEYEFLENADVNGDGTINVYDLQLLYETVCNNS